MGRCSGQNEQMPEFELPFGHLQDNGNHAVAFCSEVFGVSREYNKREKGEPYEPS